VRGPAKGVQRSSCDSVEQHRLEVLPTQDRNQPLSGLTQISDPQTSGSIQTRAPLSARSRCTLHDEESQARMPITRCCPSGVNSTALGPAHGRSSVQRGTGLPR
jgi:hypothetical protein